MECKKILWYSIKAMKSVDIQLRFLTTYKMSFDIQKYTDFNGLFGGVDFNGFCGTF
jgi:hypothetical protein